MKQEQMAIISEDGRLIDLIYSEKYFLLILMLRGS